MLQKLGSISKPFVSFELFVKYQSRKEWLAKDDGEIKLSLSDSEGVTDKRLNLSLKRIRRVLCRVQ